MLEPSTHGGHFELLLDEGRDSTHLVLLCICINSILGPLNSHLSLQGTLIELPVPLTMLVRNQGRADLDPLVPNLVDMNQSSGGMLGLECNIAPATFPGLLAVISVNSINLGVIKDSGQGSQS